jgi:HD-GYP domain-containing protein (c-di-GMP phosphodiesterase class II)
LDVDLPVFLFDSSSGALRVLILPIEDAKEGMTLAAPVTHPDYPDQELLKSGYVLEREVIKRLGQMGITFVYVGYPGLDDLDRHLAVNLSPARQKLYAQIKETITAGQLRTRPSVSYSDYYTMTRELVITLMSQGEHPIYLEHMSRMGTDAVTHAAAVAHIGLLLGIKLERYLVKERKRLPAEHAREVVNIGIAGMLHDMGKLRLPEHLQYHTCVDPPTDPGELEQWQEHAIHGFAMIRAGVEPSAAIAVAHHHQRWDGQGFPPLHHRDDRQSLLSGERIHVFGRIVAVADLYDRLATPLDTTVRRSNLEVLHEMRTRYASWCDPIVLEMLKEIAPPFPPGTVLTLSDKTSAVVVDVDPVDLYRPIVKRIVGQNWEVDERRVSLRDPSAPKITHTGKTPVEGLIPPAVVMDNKRSTKPAAPSVPEAA